MKICTIYNFGLLLLVTAFELRGLMNQNGIHHQYSQVLEAGINTALSIESASELCPLHLSLPTFTVHYVAFLVFPVFQSG
jgi:hypothetical protein